MVALPKTSAKFIVSGTLKKVTEFRSFGKGTRGRIGVQVEINHKTVWFTDYGTETSLTDKYTHYDLEDTVYVQYNTREYTDKSGTVQKSNDIVRITKSREEIQMELPKGKKLKPGDEEAFMPDKEEAADPLSDEKSKNWVFNIVNSVNDIRNCCKEIMHVLELHNEKVKDDDEKPAS